MNDEAAVVMGFFTFRVALVGTIMFFFPRIARKGLMFGIYLGEEHAESTRRELLGNWDRGLAVILLVALIVGYSIALSTGRWVREPHRHRGPRGALRAPLLLDVQEGPEAGSAGGSRAGPEIGSAVGRGRGPR